MSRTSTAPAVIESTSTTDVLIPLSDVPAIPWLRRGRTGKRPHRSVAFRWALNGLRGIRLRTVQAGGTKCTTETWLREFFDALTRLDETGGTVAPTTSGSTRAHRDADARLKVKGF